MNKALVAASATARTAVSKVKTFYFLAALTCCMLVCGAGLAAHADTTTGTAPTWTLDQLGGPSPTDYQSAAQGFGTMLATQLKTVMPWIVMILGMFIAVGVIVKMVRKPVKA